MAEANTEACSAEASAEADTVAEANTEASTVAEANTVAEASTVAEALHCSAEASNEAEAEASNTKAPHKNTNSPPRFSLGSAEVTSLICMVLRNHFHD